MEKNSAAACQETPKGRVGLVGIDAADDSYNFSKGAATYKNGDLGGARRPISQIGILLAASPEDAQRILKELQELSKPCGATISIENNVGVIRPAAGN